MARGAGRHRVGLRVVCGYGFRLGVSVSYVALPRKALQCGLSVVACGGSLPAPWGGAVVKSGEMACIRRWRHVIRGFEEVAYVRQLRHVILGFEEGPDLAKQGKANCFVAQLLTLFLWFRGFPRTWRAL